MDMVPSTEIRPVTEEDLPRVHEIAVEAFRPEFEWNRLVRGERMWRDLDGDWEEDWHRHTPDDPGTWKGKMIVTEIGNEVVGFSMWRPRSKAVVEIGANAVDPRCQNQGIGTAQILWVIGMLRDKGYRCTTVYTGLGPKSGPARAIYRKAGLRCGLATSAYFGYLEEVDDQRPKRNQDLRWAKAGDASQVQELAEIVWEPIHGQIRQIVGEKIFVFVFEKALQQRIQTFANSAAEPQRMRLLFSEGQLSGFSLLDLSSHPLLAKIMTVAVRPEMRGNGLGLNLARDAFHLTRQHGKKYVQLTAEPGEMNEDTRRFALSVGLHRGGGDIVYYQVL